MSSITWVRKRYSDTQLTNLVETTKYVGAAGTGNITYTSPFPESLKWEARVQVTTAGTYTATASCDDGVRLFVNNVQVDLPPNHWIGSAGQTASGTYNCQENEILNLRYEFNNIIDQGYFNASFSGPGEVNTYRCVEGFVNVTPGITTPSSSMTANPYTGCVFGTREEVLAAGYTINGEGHLDKSECMAECGCWAPSAPTFTSPEDNVLLINTVPGYSGEGILLLQWWSGNGMGGTLDYTGSPIRLSNLPIGEIIYLRWDYDEEACETESEISQFVPTSMSSVSINSSRAGDCLDLRPGAVVLTQATQCGFKITLPLLPPDASHLILQISKGTQGVWRNYHTPSGGLAGGAVLTVTDLDPDTTYYFRAVGGIQATYIAGAATTQRTLVCPAPFAYSLSTVVSVAAQGDVDLRSHVDIHKVTITSTGNLLEGFDATKAVLKLQRGVEGNDGFITWTNIHTQTWGIEVTHVDSGLVADKRYFYRLVSVVNGGANDGDISPSDAASCKTLPAVPKRPDMVEFDDVAGTHFVVVAPEELPEGGDYFVLYYRVEGLTDWTSVTDSTTGEPLKISPYNPETYFPETGKGGWLFEGMQTNNIYQCVFRAGNKNPTLSAMGDASSVRTNPQDLPTDVKTYPVPVNVPEDPEEPNADVLFVEGGVLPSCDCPRSSSISSRIYSSSAVPDNPMVPGFITIKASTPCGFTIQMPKLPQQADYMVLQCSLWDELDNQNTPQGPWFEYLTPTGLRKGLGGLDVVTGEDLQPETYYWFRAISVQERVGEDLYWEGQPILVRTPVCAPVFDYVVEAESVDADTIVIELQLELITPSDEAYADIYLERTTTKPNGTNNPAWTVISQTEPILEDTAGQKPQLTWDNSVFVDDGLTADTTYWYRLRAVNDTGESTSDPVAATTYVDMAMGQGLLPIYFADYGATFHTILAPTFTHFDADYLLIGRRTPGQTFSDGREIPYEILLNPDTGKEARIYSYDVNTFDAWTGMGGWIVDDVEPDTTYEYIFISKWNIGDNHRINEKARILTSKLPPAPSISSQTSSVTPDVPGSSVTSQTPSSITSVVVTPAPPVAVVTWISPRTERVPSSTSSSDFYSSEIAESSSSSLFLESSLSSFSSSSSGARRLRISSGISSGSATAWTNFISGRAGTICTCPPSSVVSSSNFPLGSSSLLPSSSFQAISSSSVGIVPSSSLSSSRTSSLSSLTSSSSSVTSSSESLYTGKIYSAEEPLVVYGRIQLIYKVSDPGTSGITWLEVNGLRLAAPVYKNGYYLYLWNTRDFFNGPTTIRASVLGSDGQVTYDEVHVDVQNSLSKATSYQDFFGPDILEAGYQWTNVTVGFDNFPLDNAMRNRFWAELRVTTSNLTSYDISDPTFDFDSTMSLLEKEWDGMQPVAIRKGPTATSGEGHPYVAQYYGTTALNKAGVKVTARMKFTPVEQISAFQTGCTEVRKIRQVKEGLFEIFCVGPAKIFEFDGTELTLVPKGDLSLYEAADATDAIVAGDKIYVVRNKDMGSSENEFFTIDRDSGQADAVTMPRKETRPVKFVEKLTDGSILWILSDEVSYRNSSSSMSSGPGVDGGRRTVSYIKKDGDILGTLDSPNWTVDYEIDNVHAEVTTSGNVITMASKRHLWQAFDGTEPVYQGEFPSRITALSPLQIGLENGEVWKFVTGIWAYDSTVERKAVSEPIRAVTKWAGANPTQRIVAASRDVLYSQGVDNGWTADTDLGVPPFLVELGKPQEWNSSSLSSTSDSSVSSSSVSSRASSLSSYKPLDLSKVTVMSRYVVPAKTSTDATTVSNQDIIPVATEDRLMIGTGQSGLFYVMYRSNLSESKGAVQVSQFGEVTVYPYAMERIPGLDSSSKSSRSRTSFQASSISSEASVDTDWGISSSMSRASSVSSSRRSSSLSSRSSISSSSNVVVYPSSSSSQGPIEIQAGKTVIFPTEKVGGNPPMYGAWEIIYPASIGGTVATALYPRGWEVDIYKEYAAVTVPVGTPVENNYIFRAATAPASATVPTTSWNRQTFNVIPTPQSSSSSSSGYPVVEQGDSVIIQGFLSTDTAIEDFWQIDYPGDAVITESVNPNGWVVDYADDIILVTVPRVWTPAGTYKVRFRNQLTGFFRVINDVPEPSSSGTNYSSSQVSSRVSSATSSSRALSSSSSSSTAPIAYGIPVIFTGNNPNPPTNTWTITGAGPLTARYGDGEGGSVLGTSTNPNGWTVNMNTNPPTVIPPPGFSGSITLTVTIPGATGFDSFSGSTTIIAPSSSSDSSSESVETSSSSDSVELSSSSESSISGVLSSSSSSSSSVESSSSSSEVPPEPPEIPYTMEQGETLTLAPTSRRSPYRPSSSISSSSSGSSDSSKPRLSPTWEVRDYQGTILASGTQVRPEYPSSSSSSSTSSELPSSSSSSTSQNQGPLATGWGVYYDGTQMRVSVPLNAQIDDFFGTKNRYDVRYSDDMGSVSLALGVTPYYTPLPKGKDNVVTPVLARTWPWGSTVNWRILSPTGQYIDPGAIGWDVVGHNAFPGPITITVPTSATTNGKYKVYKRVGGNLYVFFMRAVSSTGSGTTTTSSNSSWNNQITRGSTRTAPISRNGQYYSKTGPQWRIVNNSGGATIASATTPNGWTVAKVGTTANPTGMTVMVPLTATVGVNHRLEWKGEFVPETFSTQYDDEGNMVQVGNGDDYNARYMVTFVVTEIPPSSSFSSSMSSQITSSSLSSSSSSYFESSGNSSSSNSSGSSIFPIE